MLRLIIEQGQVSQTRGRLLRDLDVLGRIYQQTTSQEFYMTTIIQRLSLSFE